MNIPPDHPEWFEISVDINPVAHEALSAFLFDLGCDGILSETNGNSVLKAYLPFVEDFEKTRNRLEIFLGKLGEIFPEAGSFKLKLKGIESRDWGTAWRRFFKPDRITKNLLVTPAWDPVPHQPKGHIIRIDPGPAFGTGQHPSTRMCLRAMEIPGFPGSWKMLDIGTGSGILAIYGVKLGAQGVAAIDTDPEALRWAKVNIELNDLPIEVELSSKPLGRWDESFSLVTANLILGTILDLCPLFSRVTAPGGWLIISGLLREQAGGMEERISGYGFKREYSLFQEEWACMIFQFSVFSREKIA